MAKNRGYENKARSSISVKWFVLLPVCLTMGFYSNTPVIVPAHRPETPYRRFPAVVLGYRLYSPMLGRWMRRDGVQEVGGLNLCAMLGNDPVNVCDYLGQVGIPLDTPKSEFKCWLVKHAMEHYADWFSDYNRKLWDKWKSGGDTNTWTIPWKEFDSGNVACKAALAFPMKIGEKAVSKLGVGEWGREDHAETIDLKSYMLFMMYWYKIKTKCSISYGKYCWMGVCFGEVSVKCSLDMSDQVHFWNDPNETKKWFEAPPWKISDDLVRECYPEGGAINVEGQTACSKRRIFLTSCGR